MAEETWLATYIFKHFLEKDARALAKRFANASAVIRTKFFLWMFTQPPLRDFELSKRVAFLIRDKVPLGTKAWRTLDGAAQFAIETTDVRSGEQFAARAAREPFNTEAVIRAAAGIVIYRAVSVAAADFETDVLNARITKKIAELCKEPQ